MSDNFSFLAIVLFTLISCTPIQVNPQAGQQIEIVENSKGVIIDEFKGEEFAVYHNSAFRVFVAYHLETDKGEKVELLSADLDFPRIFKDTEGNVWNVYGRAISGPRINQHLKTAQFQVGYWFSFGAFFEKVTLYGESDQERIESPSGTTEWLVDPKEVRQGASKDGIPSIDTPLLADILLTEQTYNYFDDEDMLITIEGASSLQVYPHSILNWHEIVNGQIDSKNITLSYCPLTGTSMAWDSDGSTNERLTFGVSGLLYNSNLILYDRSSSSLWSQMMEQAVYGDRITEKPRRIISVEMNWRGLKNITNEFSVLSEQTGYTRDYEVYPYGDYKSTSQIYFPVKHLDSRLHPKERVIAVIVDGHAKVYRNSDF